MKKIHESKNSKKFNSTINKVHAEMDSARKYLGQWNLKWKETYSDVYCYDLQFKLEDDIAYMESMYEGLYDLERYYDDSKREGQAIERVTLVDEEEEEYVCEFRQLDWLVSNSKLARAFTFHNMGGIKYSQVKRKRTDDDQSYDYYAAYDVNNNHLSLRVKNSDLDLCFVNSDMRSYSFDNKLITEDEEYISLSETKGDNKSLRIELDRAGNVIRKHLVLGEYSYVIEGNDIVAAFMNEEALEVNDELYLMLMFAISEFEIGKISEGQLFDYINEIKEKMINAIKAIKGDVPADALKRRLDIALSMISTKRIVTVPEPINKKSKK